MPLFTLRVAQIDYMYKLAASAAVGLYFIFIKSFTLSLPEGRCVSILAELFPLMSVTGTLLLIARPDITVTVVALALKANY